MLSDQVRDFLLDQIADKDKMIMLLISEIEKVENERNELLKRVSSKDTGITEKKMTYEELKAKLNEKGLWG